MQKSVLLDLMTICGVLSAFGQNVTDSLVVTNVQLQEVEVVSSNCNSVVEQQGTTLLLDMQQLDKLPRFLGTPDPLRYLQSLPGITTNTETQAGLHIDGCDDYQSFVGINGAPVFYPNHLLGLFSTFIAPHFSLMKVEQSVHNASMPNRLGGLVETQTKHVQPTRFAAEGSIGLLASDVSLTIPCGKKSALWLSARASYPILGSITKLMDAGDVDVNYYFMDYNLTYAYHPTERDEVVISGFYSLDKVSVGTDENIDVTLKWQNLVGSAYWNHHANNYNFRSTVSFSGFDTKLKLQSSMGEGKTDANMATTEWKNQLNWYISDQMKIMSGLDYVHYFFRPLDMQVNMDGVHIERQQYLQHADEVSVYVDWRHEVTPWFAYQVGIRGNLYCQNKFIEGAPDPRFTLEFTPATDHHLYLHTGIYHQYFHKVALLDGGLPADFFIPTTSQYKGESAHAISLKYQVDFLNRQFSLSTDVYFKQLSHVVTSTNNIFSLINTNFEYEQNLLVGDGRNYGWNVLFQRNRGKLTGLVSYSLAWAKRRLPELEGINDYIYNASHSIQHNLNVILNWQVAKKWNIGATFVCTSGMPCTMLKEVYLINGQMVCHYYRYNSNHLPAYHRLDLTCSYDIIQKNNHLLGLNISIYNVYNQRNAQFMVYRGDFNPIWGSAISTILPSISLYGRW